MSPGDRRDMIKPDHPKLSLSAQCRVLNISRSTLYFRPLPASEETLALMKSIDKLFTKYPFFGSRQIAVSLARDGVKAGRHRVRRLMRLMGGSIQAAKDEPAASGPSGLPLLAEGYGDHASQSGLVLGHHLRWEIDPRSISPPSHSPSAGVISTSSPSWTGQRARC